MLITSLEGRKSKKSKKPGSMVQGQVFKGDAGFFLFNFFKVYHFYI